MLSAKRFLRKIKPIYGINAKWKARQTRKQYFRLCNYYQALAQKKQISYVENDVPQKVALQLAERGLGIGPIEPENLQILYVGSDEDQDKGGILQSLEKFGSVHHFTQSNGKYGQSVTDRTANGRRLLELVENLCNESQLHLIIGQMWNYMMPWQVLHTIKNMGIIIVNISMYDRHAFQGTFKNGEWTGTYNLIPALDLVLTAAPEACVWYAVEGCPAIFWPEASTPSVFHPMDIPKKHDICFVGGNYGVRSSIIRVIEKRGIKVECYGNGWPNERIATQDVPALFASSKIVLGIGTIGHCTDLYALKIRDFDATLSGSMYLTHANPDLKSLFDIEKEIVCYKTPKDCADKCEYYLANKKEREAIAKAGLARSLRDHTYQARFNKLFHILGILKKDS
jgi:hypothetical protein